MRCFLVSSRSRAGSLMVAGADARNTCSGVAEGFGVGDAIVRRRWSTNGVARSGLPAVAVVLLVVAAAAAVVDASVSSLCNAGDGTNAGLASPTPMVERRPPDNRFGRGGK